MIDHRQIDERSLAFGRAIATKLADRPELIGRARATIDRWMRSASPRLRPALQEWLETLEGPIEGVVALMTSRDERSTRLRQSNPFAGVLTSAERNAIIRRFAEPLADR